MGLSMDMFNVVHGPLVLVSPSIRDRNVVTLVVEVSWYMDRHSEIPLMTLLDNTTNELSARDTRGLSIVDDQERYGVPLKNERTTSKIQEQFCSARLLSEPSPSK
jgi:hypothetical protein